MISIINKHFGLCVGSVIPMPVFKSIAARYPSVTGNAYHHAAVAAFAQAAKSLNAHGVPSSEVIAYVMAAGATGADEVNAAFQTSFMNPAKRSQWRLFSLTFRDAHVILPLQAADILANTLFRQLPKYLKGEASALDEISQLALRKDNVVWKRWTEAELAGVFQEAAAAQNG